MDGGGISGVGARPAAASGPSVSPSPLRSGGVRAGLSALIGAIAVVAGAVVVAAPAAQAAFPGSDGAVVFDGAPFWFGFGSHGGFGPGSPCGRGTARDALYLLRPASTVARLLTCAPGRADHPFVSPDGSAVVFSSSVHGSPSQLYTVSIPTAGQHVSPALVSASPTDSDTYPSWSPSGDGTIVFQRTLPGALPQLYTENVGTPGSALPVFPAPTGFSDTEPVFDPADPQLIAFVRTTSGVSHIDTYDLSSRTLTDVSAQGDGGRSGDDSKPDFAPVGSSPRIVFESDRACGTLQLYTMALTGADQEPVFQTLSGQAATGHQRCRAESENPVFSPQGDALAFDQGAGGFFSSFGDGPDTVSVNASGIATGPVSSLSHFVGQEDDPNWGPLASPPAQTPEVGLPVLLPVVGVVVAAATLPFARRRRQRVAEQR